MTPLSVALFNDSYPPVLDGVAAVARNTALGLARRGIRTVLATPAFPGYRDSAEFPVIRYASLPLPFRHPYRLGVPQFDGRVRRLLASEKFSLVHAHTPFSAADLALWTARRLGIPSVITFHSKYYDDFRQEVRFARLARFMTRLVTGTLEKFDRVWTVNESTARTLRDYGYKKKVDIVPNGCDLEPFAKDKIAAARSRVNARYGFADGDILLLFVGQHIVQKNVLEILDALDLVNKGELKFKMLFVGRGPAENEMKKRAEKLGLSDRVVFGGFVADRESLRDVYARADLFVFPSLYDNSPIVVQEASGAGCPSVVWEGSNASEGITDWVNGFVSPRSVQALSEKISSAIADPAALKDVGDVAKQTLYKPWDRVMDIVIEKYIEIADRNK